MQGLEKLGSKSLKKTRNWDNFLKKWSNRSEARLTGIAIANRQFDDYCVETYGKGMDVVIQHIKTNFDEEEKIDVITDLLQDFLNHLHKTCVVNVIRGKISAVNKYLKYQRLGVDTQELVYPQTLYEEPHAITLEEIHKIFSVAKYHKVAYYLALITTGARPIEITCLRIRDISWNIEEQCYVALIHAAFTMLYPKISSPLTPHHILLLFAHQ